MKYIKYFNICREFQRKIWNSVHTDAAKEYSTVRGIFPFYWKYHWHTGLELEWKFHREQLNLQWESHVCKKTLWTLSNQTREFCNYFVRPWRPVIAFHFCACAGQQIAIANELVNIIRGMFVPAINFTYYFFLHGKIHQNLQYHIC